MKLHRGFFFLLLLFLPTQLGLHFWSDWTTVLGRRVDYLSPTIFLTDILIALTLFFWLTQASQRLKFKNFLRRNYLFLSLLAVFAALNILVSTNPPVAIYKWTKVVEYGLFGFYVVKIRPQFSRVVFPLTLGVFFTSLLAIAQFFFQHSLGGPLWWLGERTFNLNTPGIARIEFCNLTQVSCRLLLRPYATFSHPNLLGGFLAVTLPLVINQFILKKKFFYGGAIILGLVALLFSFSRSAWLSGALGLGWLAWSLVKAQKLKAILLVIGASFLLLSFLQFRDLTFTNESVVVRQALNQSAVKLWQGSPLLGVGLGNFIARLPQVLPLRAIYFLQPVHNIYFLLLAETGIVGLWFFIWIIINSLKGILDKPSFPLRNYQFALAMLLALGLIDHYPFDLQQGQLLLTLLIALAWDKLAS